MTQPIHNVTTSGATSFGSSVTVAHASSGSDSALIVDIHIRSDAVTISSVTHNGNALALVTGSLIVDNSQTLARYYMLTQDTTGYFIRWHKCYRCS